MACEVVGQNGQLVGEVDVSNNRAHGGLERSAGKIENSFDPGLREQFGAALRGESRHSQDSEFDVELLWQLRDIFNEYAVEVGAYLFGRTVEHVGNVKTPLRKPGEVTQSAPQVTRTQQHHFSASVELHDRPDSVE